MGSKLTTNNQGTADPFYQQKQLLPEHLSEAAKIVGLTVATFSPTALEHQEQQQQQQQNTINNSEQRPDVTVRYQPGYDHSYFTMATFADDHVDHAARYLFA